MVAIPSRHRSLVLLAAVVLAQVLLLAVQIKRERQGRLIRVWTVALVSPFERGGVWTFRRMQDSWNHYVSLRKTSRENEELRKELDAQKLRVQQLAGKAAEADRLGALLNFRQAHGEAPMVAARVIGSSADTASKTIYIDRGERDGVRRNMAVITPDGVVGKIFEVYRDASQVLLVTDKESGVGALLASTRMQNPVGGTGEGLLAMKYVSNDDPVPLGEQVLTSGQDRIFPKDLPVGTVVETKPGVPFQQVRVKPAAHLDRLEEVIVLLTLQELDMKKEPEPPGAPPVKKDSVPAEKR